MIGTITRPILLFRHKRLPSMPSSPPPDFLTFPSSFPLYFGFRSPFVYSLTDPVGFAFACRIILLCKATLHPNIHILFLILIRSILCVHRLLFIARVSWKISIHLAWPQLDRFLEEKCIKSNQLNQENTYSQININLC